MGDEINPADEGKPLEPIPESGQIEPWVEESGGLGALSWGDDYKHKHSLPWISTKRGCAPPQGLAHFTVGNLQILG